MHDFANNATPLPEVQGEDQPSARFNQINNKNQNRRPIWQTRGSTVTVTTSSETASQVPGKLYKEGTLTIRDMAGNLTAQERAAIRVSHQDKQRQDSVNLLIA